MAAGYMAKKPAAGEVRNGDLQQALAALINQQALFVGQLARMDARIESELVTIKSILLHHEQMLEALPEAIRQKIGFKP